MFPITVLLKSVVDNIFPSYLTTHLLTKATNQINRATYMALPTTDRRSELGGGFQSSLSPSVLHLSIHLLTHIDGPGHTRHCSYHRAVLQSHKHEI